MSVTAFDHDYVATPGARPLRARPLGNLSAMTMGVGALLTLFAFAAFSDPPPSVAAATDALKKDAFYAPNAPDALSAPIATTESTTTKLFAAFDMTPPEFAKEKKVVAVRRLEQGAGREESLTFGQFSGDGAFMRLDVQVASGGKLAASDFFLDITRRAAQAGLAVGKIGQPSPLPSRFGAFESADIRVSKAGAAGGSAGERSCLAVRLTGGKAPLEVVGIACGGAAKPIDRRAMGCIVDRLDYLSNGENKALDEFFLNAELARGQGCAGAGLTPNAEKSTWLDARSSPPPLKKTAAPAKKAKGKH